MMTGYLLDAKGGRLDLPPFVSWDLKRTGTVPCDSFDGECPWDGGLDPRLEEGCRLILEEDGQRRFTGVLDECRLTWDEKGGALAVSGRGMAALLLDNEALGRDYQVATLEDILREHVTPYGIQVGGTGSLPAVPDFSVATGSSQWQVLYSFARYHGGVEPRFDVYGKLWVGGGAAGRRLELDDKAGPIAVTWQDRRYGVCSEVLVQDRWSLTPQRVVNGGFVSQGGRRRKVYTMPGKSAYEAMRYSGQYQLDRSYGERFRLEVTLPGSWFCEPGDELSVYLEKPRVTGLWKVLETRAVLDGKGSRVRLTLGR